MSVINSTPLLMGEDGYQISRSVRLRSSASAYFNRTPASAGNRKTWTWSAWVKRGSLGTLRTLFGVNVVQNDSQAQAIFFGSDDKLYVTPWTNNNFVTNAVYRDPSAWYHIVVAFDSTNATANNRVVVYVNGVNQSGTYPLAVTLNADYAINQAGSHRIGDWPASGFSTFDGYLTEINFIDGQALTPSSFGENDAITGVWKPKKYAGTYGTNGFYLNFSDNSNNTAATIGKDYSGNGNNWTPNNISVTSGVTYDSMLDTPTPYADGGNGRGNYAVVNPLFRNSSMISEGNLYFNKSTTGWATCQATIPLPSSKTYFEALATLVGGANSGVFIGIATASATQDSYGIANQWSFGGTGNVLSLYNQTTLVTPSGSSAANDIFQVAYDGATGNLWFGKNNTWYNSTGGTTGDPSTGANPTMTLTAGTEVFPCAICYANGLKFTFGQRPFTYTPPTGFKALNTQNLPDATIKKGNQYFDATTYTGNGSILSVTNSGSMQPDFVWIKQRNGTASHILFDAVRGADNVLRSNGTDAENASGISTALYGGLTSFDATGFTVDDGSDTTFDGANGSGDTYVGWQWKESVTAGFDIVTYTGNGSNRTIAHSLGVAPKLIIVKDRNRATDWSCLAMAANNGSGHLGWIRLNTTDAWSTTAILWNNTAPTSSVFSIGTYDYVNYSGSNYVAYLFAEVAGFSKFGSYTGNGSTDGPFVYLGFRPRFVLVKKTSATSSWSILDTARDDYNVADNPLLPNLSNAETTSTSTSGAFADMLSNGFKARGNSGDINDSGATYIYAAFAENPFKNSLAR